MVARPGAWLHDRWSVFVVWLAACAAALVVVASCATIGVDPYWIWWEQPPWLRWTGGVNRALDVEMRRAKPLQLFVRPAETVLIGSSTVYRGLRPADVPGGPATTFNLGLSSLTAAELPALARLVVARQSRRVVIGLDYFMFTEFPGPPPVDGSLAFATARAGARAKAVLSIRALTGSLPSAIGRAYEPGTWQGDGFKATPDYPPDVTERIAREQNFEVMAYRPETLGSLSAALDALQGSRVEIYLSPMNGFERSLASLAGRDREITRWRADVDALARAKGAVVLDLVDDHPFGDFDPRRGSSGAWIDPLHFKPEVGRWIMSRLAAASRT